MVVTPNLSLSVILPPILIIVTCENSLTVNFAVVFCELRRLGLDMVWMWKTGVELSAFAITMLRASWSTRVPAAFRGWRKDLRAEQHDEHVCQTDDHDEWREDGEPSVVAILEMTIKQCADTESCDCENEQCENNALKNGVPE